MIRPVLRELRDAQPAVAWRNQPWCLPPGPVTLSALISRLDALASNHMAHDAARPGALVEVIDLDSHERLSVRLTLPGEDDPERGAVSVFSPLGASLLGRRAGDCVRVPVFRWHSHLCITAVTPPDTPEPTSEDRALKR